MPQATAKFCAGCGHPIVLMILEKVLEEMGMTAKAVVGLDIGCSLLAWNYLPINTFQTHHGRVTPAVMGFKRARPESLCFGYAGDGGAYAIGLQSLLHAARRDEPVTVIVVNNALYAMTGGQTAPTTLKGEVTPTSPYGCDESSLQGPELLVPVLKKGAFVARTAVNHVPEMKEYFKRAIEAQRTGHFSLIEFLSLCPTNWRTKGHETLKFLDEKMKPEFKMGIIYQ